MTGKQIRLGKLAGELNISISKLVDVFQANGVFLDMNPNSKVSIEDAEMIQTYLDRYEELNSILTKHKNHAIKQIEQPKVTTYSTLINLKKRFGEPKIIYKYFSDNDYTIDALANSYLYHSYFMDFNDPFDCNPYLINIQGGADRKTRELFKETLQKSMDINGICCFSRNNNSILMWSHYANKHKGICLEFENLDEPIKTLDIHYVRNFNKPDLLIDHGEALYHMIYTKSDSWAYEQELRSFIRVNSNSVEARKIKYDSNKLKAIYFGVKADQAFIQNIKKIALEINPKVKFYLGRLKPNEFGIDWIQIKR